MIRNPENAAGTTSDCLTKVKLQFFVKFKTAKINTLSLQNPSQTITVHKNSNIMVFYKPQYHASLQEKSWLLLLNML
ncbi:hypothetical protein ATS74_04460 [Pseudoalteromonas sp. H103]|uniref:Uncharacterized protein n=1 Tax=Pseudoalteromonas carrageenovora IAM 12662 TaxID=1314868 RepID=A0A2K4XB64_PSEVC|nr:hypothetical protein ATS74_04460 [Pseudoalteromonas sp. H103]SOU41559.1 conserved protein of unknown function [Pseudoalteromonas carrageenovora IAM 12662]